MKIFAALFFAVFAFPAFAQQPCFPAAEVISNLISKYAERPVWEGVVNIENGPVQIVLLQSKEGGWTLLSLRGQTACIMATGEDGTSIEIGEPA